MERNLRKRNLHQPIKLSQLPDSNLAYVAAEMISPSVEFLEYARWTSSSIPTSHINLIS